MSDNRSSRADVAYGVCAEDEFHGIVLMADFVTCLKDTALKYKRQLEKLPVVIHSELCGGSLNDTEPIDESVFSKESVTVRLLCPTIKVFSVGDSRDDIRPLDGFELYAVCVDIVAEERTAFVFSLWKDDEFLRAVLDAVEMDGCMRAGEVAAEDDVRFVMYSDLMDKIGDFKMKELVITVRAVTVGELLRE